MQHHKGHEDTHMRTAAPTPTEGLGKLLEGGGARESSLGAATWGTLPPGGGGRAVTLEQQMAHSMTETPSWGQPLPVSSCQSLIRSPDSQGCWTSLPALTGSLRQAVGRDWLLAGQQPGTGGLEPRNLLFWGPGRSPQAASGRAEHGADLAESGNSVSASLRNVTTDVFSSQHRL